MVFHKKKSSNKKEHVEDNEHQLPITADLDSYKKKSSKRKELLEDNEFEPIDKSWMTKDRMSTEYENGVESFLRFALRHSGNKEAIRCPCFSCGNLMSCALNEIRDHLYRRGIDQSYIRWIRHGEEFRKNVEDESNDIDARFEQTPRYQREEVAEMVEDAYNQCAEDPDAFKSFLEDAERPLYPGCSKFTKLSALMTLYNIKGRYGWSDISFSELLGTLVNMLPSENSMPSSLYEAKKIMNALGLEYEKIHACPNDCILYRKGHKDLCTCPTCGLSRWKQYDGSGKKNEGNDSVKKVPAKVLWYFPLITRFNRMFKSVEIAKLLTWHAHDREVDGKLRHPADAPAWKLVDHMWPIFAEDPRNLRLALSADGINPHRSLSSRYSCWPVLTITYNLPPWLCMKRKFMMLSLLIPGPNQPGNDIDVYLAPLIDDLQTLWDEGVKVYDAYKQEFFTLRAVLLWTISDLPALGNLSGCTVKGYYACPVCGKNTYAQHLEFSKKIVYPGSRKFLDRYHPYRRLKKVFNGEREFGAAPKQLTGKEVLNMVSGISKNWGKVKGKSRSLKDRQGEWMKKKSIFFDLEYWEHLHVRHTLDVMHIEKNVTESVYGTLLNIPGKTKDGVNARLDLVKKGLRTQLAPTIGNKRSYLPQACYTLTKDEKKIFCQTLMDIKVPEGYSSNIRSLVSMNELKLYGLKSHDCHALMQQLLPVAIRSIMPKTVRYALTRLSFFFNAICKKVVDVDNLTTIQNDLIVTLCMLEKQFPPSFFDIMVHLTTHLVAQVRMCGPVYLSWMYPFERYMKVLKGYVRNHNRPEGCIAECYIAEEAIEFCSDYLSNVKAIGDPTEKVLKSQHGEPLSGGYSVLVDEKEWEQARLYVLRNVDEVQPYIQEHMDEIKLQHPRESTDEIWLQNYHNTTFATWLEDKVSNVIQRNGVITHTLKWIAHTPDQYVLMFSGYLINGCRFHTKDRDEERVTQSSGVSIVASTNVIAKNRTSSVQDVSYFGVIKEIWELNYHLLSVPVFKCDWVDSRGVKVDEFGFTLVDLKRIGYRSDSFILASQAKQVFYVQDQVDPRWSIVLSTTHQKDYMPKEDDEVFNNFVEHDPCTNKLPDPNLFDAGEDDNIDYARLDCDGVWVDN